MPEATVVEHGVGPRTDREDLGVLDPLPTVERVDVELAEQDIKVW